MSFGYTSHDETLSTDGAVDGWDPVVHRDICSPNVFLRQSPPGQYPLVVLWDFDECHGLSDFVKEWSNEHGRKYNGDDFACEQKKDLQMVAEMMHTLTRRLKKLEADHMKEVLSRFRCPPKNAGRLGLDAREFSDCGGCL